VEIRKTYEEDEQIYSTVRSIRRNITEISQQMSQVAQRNDPSAAILLDQLTEKMQQEQMELARCNAAKIKRQPVIRH